MMSKRHNKSYVKFYALKWKVAIIATLLLLIIGSFLPERFTLIHYQDQQCKISAPNFGLYWIHSVDKTPWIEYYERQQEQPYGFTLIETQFRTFGAGVPHTGEVIPSDDGLIHLQMDQRISEFNWIVDQDVQSTILLPNHQHWKIYQIVDRYSEITIKNLPLNFWQRLFTRNCHAP